MALWGGCCKNMAVEIDIDPAQYRLVVLTRQEQFSVSRLLMSVHGDHGNMTWSGSRGPDLGLSQIREVK